MKQSTRTSERSGAAAPTAKPLAARKLSGDVTSRGPGQPAAGINSVDQPHDEMIRRTAYALYEARGHTEGCALDDWLRAEQQMSRSG